MPESDFNHEEEEMHTLMGGGIIRWKEPGSLNDVMRSCCPPALTAA